VACHAHGARGISAAIAAGVNDLQHVTFLGKKQAEEAAARGCTVTPTSWAVRSAVELPALAHDKQRILEAHAESVQRAARLGIPVLVGSDAFTPNAHGRNYRELACLVEEGLPALKAWHGATGLPSSLFGLADTGTLEPGRRADILLFSDDVIAEPRLFSERSLVEVIKDGVGHREGLPIAQARAKELLLK
jgi:imidazolonepropionase-like amidohydrolase